MKKINCNSCGWSWKLSDGGSDPYICHKCGCDNSKIKIVVTEEQFKNIFKKK